MSLAIESEDFESLPVTSGQLVVDYIKKEHVLTTRSLVRDYESQAAWHRLLLWKSWSDTVQRAPYDWERDLQEEYRANLTDAINMAILYGDLKNEMPDIEPYLAHFMDTWPTRPTLSFLVEPTVEAISDRAIAAEYLRRMIGDQWPNFQWSPVSLREQDWLDGQIVSLKLA